MAGAWLLASSLASPPLGPSEAAFYQHPLLWLAPQPAAFGAANLTRWRRSAPARPAAAAPRFVLGLSRPAAPAPLGAAAPLPLTPWSNASPGWGEFFTWMIVAAMLEIGHGMKNMVGYFLAVYVVMRVMS